MPNIDIDINIDEFVSACNTREKLKLLEVLSQDGYDPSTLILNSERGYDSQKFQKSLVKLLQGSYSLSKQDEEIINLIASKL